MTQLESARAGVATPAMARVAEREGVPVETVLAGVAAGEIVIPCNLRRRGLDPCGFGRGLRTKVNASIGMSQDRADPGGEEEKLAAALEAGADAIMDLSSGGDIGGMRRRTLALAPVPVGTVPVYQAAKEAIEERGGIVELTAEDLFAAMEEQAADGVDFMAVHCALNRQVLERLRQQGRVTDIVSRGGAFLTGWMLHNDRENPLYAEFDRVLDIARRWDVTLSIGDAIRPGCLADSLDRAQVQGLLLVGELVERARAAGVQVMVEGPGHVPLDEIETTIRLEKELCHGAPYFVLGTLVTDVCPGYDHITAAIGGAVSAMAGADFICYVTPAEHLGLPDVADVRDGVVAARIAAHAGDVAKGVRGADGWDRAISAARREGDRAAQQALAVFPPEARAQAD
ncbi:MAG: phosphomethylpyrimidine synthase ThiC [Thermaerobacter sp.]|jgi:phosphomethylpyrimidine synthase|nr:phosphomethylpyrimidine synthase ThiC [Thermaerobacter sp.]